MPGTTRVGLPYPTGSDAPDGPGGIYNLANTLDNQSVWTQFNPTLGFTPGSTGSTTFKYRREFGDIHVKGHIQFSGSGISANTMYADLPFKAASAEWPRAVSGRARDVSVNKTFSIYIEFTADASTNYQIEVVRTDGTYATTDGGMSTAIPWADNDYVDLDFVYTPQAVV